MAKDLPVTLDGKVIYHIKLTDSFQGLAEELKQLGYQADQKICIISDSNVAKLYAETVKNILTKSFPQIFCYEFQAGEASKNTDTVNGVYEFLLGRRVEEKNITPSFDREDLAALLDSNNSEQHSEPDNELKLFQNALDFADLRVRDCMVPRVDVEAVDIDDTSIEQLTARFVDSKYSRIFVWRKSIDNIVGYVNSKSLFTRPRQIADVMMEVNFVPETMPLQLMLENFIKHRSNIAVVIDEFGGTAGVISLEDVLEQIFGEIEDEHDIPDLTEKQVGPDEYVLSCRLEVKYLNEKYSLGIEESKEYDTLAGFIIYNYEGIPTAGETVFIGGLQLRILRTTRSRIELARVKKL